MMLFFQWFAMRLSSLDLDPLNPKYIHLGRRQFWGWFPWIIFHGHTISSSSPLIGQCKSLGPGQWGGHPDQWVWPWRRTQRQSGRSLLSWDRKQVRVDSCSWVCFVLVEEVGAESPGMDLSQRDEASESNLWDGNAWKTPWQTGKYWRWQFFSFFLSLFKTNPRRRSRGLLGFRSRPRRTRS